MGTLLSTLHGVWGWQEDWRLLGAFGSKGQVCRVNLISLHFLLRDRLKKDPGTEVLGRVREATLQRAKGYAKKEFWLGSAVYIGPSSSGQGQCLASSTISSGRAQGTLGRIS